MIPGTSQKDLSLKKANTLVQNIMSASKMRDSEGMLNNSKVNIGSNYSKNYSAANTNQIHYGHSENKKKFSNPYTFSRTNTSKNLGLTSKFSKKIGDGVNTHSYETDSESIRFTRLREKSLPSA
jgi:hypothetical protein